MVEILWKHPEKFEGIIPRLGVFHSKCKLLSIIGKRFQDAGLRDLRVKAGIVADGSVTGVIKGWKYNRAVRVHKLLFEAFFADGVERLLPWLESNHSNDIFHVEETTCREPFRRYVSSVCPCDDAEWVLWAYHWAIWCLSQLSDTCQRTPV